MKDNDRTHPIVLSVGPVLIEGEFDSEKIASSQWVFFNHSFAYSTKVHADQVIINDSEVNFKAMNTTPIILGDKQ